jgi:hypothetical protein
MRGPQRRPARTAVTSRATRSGSCGPGRPAHRPRRRSPSVPCPFLHDRGGPPIASNALRAPVRARARTASARTAAAALRCAPACAGRDSSCTVLVTISRTSEQTGASGAGNRHHHHSPARLTAAHSGSSIRTRAPRGASGGTGPPKRVTAAATEPATGRCQDPTAAHRPGSRAQTHSGVNSGTAATSRPTVPIAQRTAYAGRLAEAAGADPAYRGAPALHGVEHSRDAPPGPPSP